MILNKIPSALLILGTSLCFATIGPSNVLDHNTEKDTGTLYQDTSKKINQSISLHNNAAEPAKVITTTEIRRVPKYEYYNVYKTKTVWKCLPNGGGGGAPAVFNASWTYTIGQKEGGAIYDKGAVSSKNGWTIDAGNGIMYTGAGPGLRLTKSPCGTYVGVKVKPLPATVCGKTISASIGALKKTKIQATPYTYTYYYEKKITITVQ